MVSVLHNFQLSVAYSPDESHQFTMKIDEYDVPVDLSFVKPNHLKISIDCPVPVSIILTMDLSGRTFMYEKNILSPKFMDQVLCVGATSGSRFSSRLIMRRKALMNPIWDELFDNGGSGDFIIIAKGEEIKLSKELLKIHSSVFAAMFETDCIEAKENKVKVKDFTFDVVKIIVKMLYSGTVPHGSTFEMMQEVCRFADKYDLVIFWDVLTQWFDDYLTFHNVCQVANVANTYNFSNLLDKCASILVGDIKNAHKMDNFNDLNAVVLRLTLTKYGSV